MSRCCDALLAGGGLSFKLDTCGVLRVARQMRLDDSRP